MCSIKFSLPNSQIKEIRISSDTTIKDVKIQLAQECGVPWNELLILQYGTILKNASRLSQNGYCRCNMTFQVEKIEPSSFEKYNQQICKVLSQLQENQEYEIALYKQKYEEENIKRKNLLETKAIELMASEQKIKEMEQKMRNLQNKLNEALTLNKAFEKEIQKLNAEPISTLERKVFRIVENFFWPKKSQKCARNQMTQSQDLVKLSQDLRSLKQQDDESQATRIVHENRYAETQKQQNGRYVDFDLQQTVSKFQQGTPIQEVKKDQEQKKENKRYTDFDDQSKIDSKAQLQLVSIIGEAAERVTKTNNQNLQFCDLSTTQKFQQRASTVICQPLSDKYKFDCLPDVQVLSKTYQVRRISITNQVFEKKIEKLYTLDPYKDFQVTEECQWECIRTEKPFQQKKKMNLYLMKKQSDENELYVIKERLCSEKISLVDAINLCRPQLIAKYFMQKFLTELNNTGKQAPIACYADIIILQDQHQNYWIAERYFGGDSVKYNNNFGYILNDSSPLNHLAQAFTYYTYFTSNFTCMINNIQRVGKYFTDPVVNTNEGDFDENDMGQDGFAMFIVHYEGKRHLGKEYLDALEIQ